MRILPGKKKVASDFYPKAPRNTRSAAFVPPQPGTSVTQEVWIHINSPHPGASTFVGDKWDGFLFLVSPRLTN